MIGHSNGMLGGLLLLALATTTACSDASDSAKQSTAASAGLIQDRSSSSPEEALFVENCSMCHREMGMGTVLLSRRVDAAMAQLEKRQDLSAEFVVQATRMGIGNMPPIPPGEVSDEDLNRIAEYLADGPAK